MRRWSTRANRAKRVNPSNSAEFAVPNENGAPQKRDPSKHMAEAAVLVIRSSCGGTAWEPNRFHQLLNVLRWSSCRTRHQERCSEVEHRTNRPEVGRWDAEQILRAIECRRAWDEEPSKEQEEVQTGRNQTGQHTCDSTSRVHPLGEDAHHQRREQGRSGKTEGQRHHLSREARGLRPRYTATQMDTNIEIRAASSSPFSEISGLNTDLMRS